MPDRIKIESEDRLMHIMSRSSVDILIALLDEGYDANAWHGPNLMQSLKGVRVEQAAWRPADGQRNLWEITVHAAYWKHRVWQAIQSDAPAFGYPGKDWFTRPETME